MYVGKIFIGNILQMESNRMVISLLKKFRLAHKWNFSFVTYFEIFRSYSVVFCTQGTKFLPPSALLQLSKYIQIVSLMSEIYPAWRRIWVSLNTMLQRIYGLHRFENSLRELPWCALSTEQYRVNKTKGSGIKRIMPTNTTLNAI